MNQLTQNGSRMIYFSRWSRKKFAAFNSLHRIVKICALSLTVSMVAQPSKVKAQPGSTQQLSVEKEEALDEVVVTAERTPVSMAKLSKIVTVISKSEIDAAPATNLEDLLEYALNVDVRQRGGFGIQSDISIKGGHYEQTLILLNGVNITDPQSGHLSLNLPIDIQSIDRIEILQGPAARVLGPNAFAGVINIITGTRKINQVQASLMGGQNGLNRQALGLNLMSKKLSHHLSASRTQCDGYIKNTDFNNINLFYHGKTETKTGNFSYQAGYTAKDYGANAFYSAKYPNQFEKNRTTITSVSFTSKTKIQISPTVYWRRNQDEFQLFRSNPASWYKGHNYHQTNTYGFNLNLSYKSRLGTTSAGTQLRREEILSNNIGTPLREPIPVKGTDTTYRLGYSRNNYSLFAEHSFAYKRWYISGGVLANQNSDYSGWNYSPGIDLSFNVTDPLKIYATANHTLRMPSFTDLFYTSATHIGNQHLKPEKATSYELGVKYNKSVISAHTSGFVRYGTNLIDWVKLPSETVWHSRNHTDITFFGVESSIQARPVEQWGETFPIKLVTLSYSYLQSDKQSDGYQSKYVLDHLKHKLSLGLSHSIWKAFSASWQISYQDRLGGFAPYNPQTNTYDAEVPFKPVWLTDSRLNWTYNDWKIYVEVANLFDVKFYDHADVIQPGRWFKAGLQYNLELK